jgi:hypothetical protein
MRRTRRFVPVAALVLSIAAAAPAVAAPRFVGYVGDGSGRAYKVAGQGGLHQLVLTDSRGENVRYRVCIRGGAGRIHRCFKRRLRGFGHHALNVSRLVNDRGGPGAYRVRWLVEGRTVSRWRFVLEPEGV